MIINSKPEKIASQASLLTYDLLVALSGALILALSAQVAFRLPFTPVPVTAQTLVVMLIGGFLGSNRGVLAIFLYLSAGVAGFPVFSGFGTGLHHMLGPTGGYIIGLIGGTYVAGTFVKSGDNHSFFYTFLIMLLSSAVIYFIGILWLGTYLGFHNILAFGVVPFIPGDIMKSAVAAGCLTGIKQINNLRF